jgi:hypothetical protein
MLLDDGVDKVMMADDAKVGSLNGYTKKKKMIFLD